jgi:hypothetical protein
LAKFTSTLPFTLRADARSNLVDGWIIDLGTSIDTLSGNDTITGMGAYVVLPNGVLDKVGIGVYGALLTGLGNDNVKGVGGVAGIHNPGLIDTGDGADILTGSGYNGIHNSGMLNMGGFNDQVLGYGGPNGIWNSGSLLLGDGADKCYGEGTEIGIFNGSLIETGPGNDTLQGIGGNIGIANAGGGPLFGRIFMGTGNDRLIAQGRTGLTNIDTIDMGAGNDFMSLTGGIEAVFNSGQILMGDGLDTLEIVSGIYAGSGAINMGLGNDTLICSVSTTLIDHLNIRGTVDGGPGIDKILLRDGTYQTSAPTAFSPFGSIGCQGMMLPVKTTSFERVGGVSGGLFTFTNGTLIVQNGVASFTPI